MSETVVGDMLVCEVTCPTSNEGGPGVAHGGWTASVLDEALGHVAPSQGQFAVTGTLTVRYHRPAPIGVPMCVRAWVTERTGAKWMISGELTATNGDLVASAHGIWVERDPATHFTTFSNWLGSGPDCSDSAAESV